MGRTLSPRFLAYCGASAAAALLVALGSFGYFRSPASVAGELASIAITPAGSAAVAAGGSLTLTAEGNYGTTTMPVRADWKLTGDAQTGKISACDTAKTCTFTAGEKGGSVDITAEAEGKTATMKITVEENLANPFTDELPAWALEAIVRMHRKGIVKGYDDGRYGPVDNVTNGQVAVLITRILQERSLIGAPGGACADAYADVPADHYASAAACLFRARGWAGEGGSFRPDDPATRGETAAFLSRVLGETFSANVPQTQTFDDVPAGHALFREIGFVNASGLMTGYPNGDFGVRDNLNRAAVAVIMFRTLNTIQEKGVTKLAEGSGAVHSAAPAAQPASSRSAAESASSAKSVATDSTAKTPNAACSVLAPNTASPKADDPDAGKGYAKEMLALDTADIPTVRSVCTDAIYTRLMERYCADDRNTVPNPEWGVLLYDRNGEITSGGGGARSLNPTSCPKEKPAAAPAEGTKTGTVNLKDGGATIVDFSSGEYRGWFNELPYDLSFTWHSKYIVQVSTAFWTGTYTKTTKAALAGGSYDKTGKEDCIRTIEGRKTFDIPYFQTETQGVCFVTDDGFIGKVGNVSRAKKTLQYTIWPYDGR